MTATEAHLAWWFGDKTWDDLERAVTARVWAKRRKIPKWNGVTTSDVADAVSHARNEVLCRWFGYDSARRRRQMDGVGGAFEAAVGFATNRACSYLAVQVVRDGWRERGAWAMVGARLLADDSPERKALRRQVRRGVELLPARERRVIDGIYWEHASFADIADELGVSKTTAYRAKASAERRLGEWLIADGTAFVM